MNDLHGITWFVLGGVCVIILINIIEQVNKYRAKKVCLHGCVTKKVLLGYDVGLCADCGTLTDWHTELSIPGAPIEWIFNTKGNIEMLPPPSNLTKPGDKIIDHHAVRLLEGIIKQNWRVIRDRDEMIAAFNLIGSFGKMYFAPTGENYALAYNYENLSDHIKTRTIRIGLELKRRFPE